MPNRKFLDDPLVAPEAVREQIERALQGLAISQAMESGRSAGPKAMQLILNFGIECVQIGREAAAQQERARLDSALRLAKEATNGWACYAKRQCEHDDIARLHREISAVASHPPPTQEDR